MTVNRNRVFRFTAEQLIERHSRQLAFDIPQCHIHACDGVIHHRTISPVGVHLHHLPQIFDVVAIAPHQKWFQVFIHHGFYRQRPLLKRGAAIADKIFIGGDFDQHQVVAIRAGDETFNVGD